MCADLSLRRAPAVLLAALLLAGCRAASSGKGLLDASHPASAQAPAGVLPARSSALAPDAAPAAAPAPVGVSGSSPAKPEPVAGALFVCPMHPEVTSDVPSRCPECGMRLEEVEAGGQGGGHDHPRD